MAMSNQSWDEVMRCVMHKMQEAGMRPTTDPTVFFTIMRDNWELLCNHAAVVAYLAEKDLAAKIAAQAEAQAQADALAAEIAEMEG